MIKKYLLVLVGLTILYSGNLISKEINIYSHRQPFLINPFLESFTAETGNKTNIVY